MSKPAQRLLIGLALGSLIWASFWTGVRWQGEANRIVSSSQPPADVDFTPLWQAWQLIDKQYVSVHAATTSTSSSSVISDQAKVWGTIEGLVHSLGDPYSEFLSPRDKRQFEQEIQGQFGGVGIEIGVRNGALTVISALENTPAKQAGLKAGDHLISVDGQSVAALNISEVIDLIRGEIGSQVKLMVQREGRKEALEFKLIRGIINVPTIETEARPDGVFVIKLFNFGATAPNLFRSALRAFVEARSDKLILDLRGNPGGFLDGAVDLASWFLPLGRPVAIERRSRGAEDIVYRSRGYDIFNADLKFLILVDRGTASAAEILAGALREHGRAKLVGEQTFGKGSVQELIPLTPDTSLKLTIARWLTPNGVSISEQGLKPDIVVKPSEKSGDAVLDQAVKLLLKK